MERLHGGILVVYCGLDTQTSLTERKVDAVHPLGTSARKLREAITALIEQGTSEFEGRNPLTRQAIDMAE